MKRPATRTNVQTKRNKVWQDNEELLAGREVFGKRQRCPINADSSPRHAGSFLASHTRLLATDGKRNQDELEPLSW